MKNSQYLKINVHRIKKNKLNFLREKNLDNKKWKRKKNVLIDTCKVFFFFVKMIA